MHVELEAALRAPEEARDRLVDVAVAAMRAAPGGTVPGEVVARRALWINAYNVLTLRAVRGRGVSLMATWYRCAVPRHEVAGRRFTLDEVEHGLLRDNARAPYRVTRPLRRGDPRLAWAVPLDGRVHFALNCGAASCPPVRVYDGACLDAQLDVAERSFLGAETRIDDNARMVTTSQLCQFYAADLGGTEELVARIERACGRTAGSLLTYRLRFAPYDWSAKIRFAAA